MQFFRRDGQNSPNQAHEMTLEEKRELVIKGMVRDEEEFAEGTVSRSFLDFFKYLQENTDIFDPVMVGITMQGRENDRDALKFNDDAIKEIVNTYLERPDATA